MAEIKLLPLAGINNAVKDDAQLQGDRLSVRDANNVDINATGRVELRRGARKVSPTLYRDIWQSPLHGDTFGRLGDEWVKIDPVAWTHEALVVVGEGDIAHEVLNNQVCAATASGIYVYDGQSAKRLTIDTPPSPLALSGTGSLPAGTYGVSVAWLRGTLESAPSSIAFVDVPDAGGLQVTLPPSLDGSVTGARLYLTKQNGGELRLAGDYAVGASIQIPLLPTLGRAADFKNLSPMPSGKFLKLWRGRLLIAQANVLRWSESLAYHLHDQRSGFVLLPQRITFLQPVDGGIWVGQSDHVVFLAGSAPENFSVQRKASRPPVPGSATLVPAEVAGPDASPDGSTVAVWLADNGYVIGTGSGALAEVHAGSIKGIAAQAGTSVVLDRRLITAVT
jgi:hypothetical protein